MQYLRVLYLFQENCRKLMTSIMYILDVHVNTVMKIMWFY